MKIISMALMGLAGIVVWNNVWWVGVPIGAELIVLGRMVEELKRSHKTENLEEKKHG